MSDKPTKTRVSQEVYDIVKFLLSKDASYSQICQVTQLSYTTVCRISNSKTIDEYKKMSWTKKDIEKANSKASESPIGTDKPAQQPQSVTVQTTYYVSQKLDRMTELLTGISSKLANLMESVNTMVEVWTNK